MLALRLFVWLALGVGAIAYAEWYEAGPAVETRASLYMRQLEDDDEVPTLVRRDYASRKGLYAAGTVAWLGLGVLFFLPEFGRLAGGGGR
jgi:hypothetical protein